MPFSTKTVVKAQDPHAQARFWALALDWVLEDHSTLIGGLKQAGVITDDDIIEVDGVVSWKDAAAIRDPEAAVDDRSGIGTNRMLFERGDAPGPAAAEPGNVRLHLDVHVGPDSRAEHVEALLAAGATHLWDAEQNGSSWVTLSDPEGNPLCIA